MSPSAIGLIVSLLTIVGSGVVSAYVTHRLNASKAERDFKLEKLERLYNACHDFCNMLGGVNITWFDVMNGKYDYNKALDINLEGNARHNQNAFQDTEMLVMLYFPALKPRWEEILAVREILNKVIGAFQRDYKANGPLESHVQYVKPLQQALFALDTSDKAFKDALFKVAEGIQGGK